MYKSKSGIYLHTDIYTRIAYGCECDIFFFVGYLQ